MEFIEILKAIVLGIIQGITEWLPVSSTGHMILADEFIKMKFSENFINLFMVVIQFGSILAVVVLFFNKLYPFSRNKSRREKENTMLLWSKVIVAVIPAGVIGILFDDKIESLFFKPIPIALALIIYGVLFIVLENRRIRPSIKKLEDLDYRTAILIGAFQVLALIPGTSRSGSTILGAVFLGTSRYVAAEFSFFLAIPVMMGASALKVIKYKDPFTTPEIAVLATGMIVAFLVSLLVIKFLMNYVKKHDFKVFGYYRIVLGIIVLAYFIIKANFFAV